MLVTTVCIRKLFWGWGLNSRRMAGLSGRPACENPNDDERQRGAEATTSELAPPSRSARGRFLTSRVVSHPVGRRAVLLLVCVPCSLFSCHRVWRAVWG